MNKTTTQYYPQPFRKSEHLIGDRAFYIIVIWEKYNAFEVSVTYGMLDVHKLHVYLID